MQLIYGGKTSQSLPRFEFPSGFSLSANPKHFSNTDESLKFLKEIIKPCVEKQRELLKCSVDQKALVIMDVFTGQMTPAVLDAFKEENICIVNVPANMTKFYQPLDLTVNGYAKRFLKRKFNEWYSGKVCDVTVEEFELLCGGKIQRELTDYETDDDSEWEEEEN